MLNYTSSSSVGFANLQKLGASLNRSSPLAALAAGPSYPMLNALVGYMLSTLNALGVMLTSVHDGTRLGRTAPHTHAQPHHISPRCSSHHSRWTMRASA